MQTQIQSIQEFAKSKYDSRIWENHISLVVNFAKQLAQQLGGDSEIVEIAAYLHDVAKGPYPFDPEINKIHDQLSAIEAEKLLTELNFPSDQIQEISDCILKHRAKKENMPQTLNEKIIAVADAMAHLDGFLHLFYLRSTNFTYPEVLDTMTKKLKKLKKKIKLIPEIRPSVSEKYKLAQKFLKEFGT